MSLNAVFTVPGQAPQRVALSESRMLIGTLLSNHIVLRASDVDPIHAMIEEVDGKWVITDLGSDGGVKINGSVIPVEEILKHGDKISIGAVELVIEEEPEAIAIDDVVPPPIPRPGAENEPRSAAPASSPQSSAQSVSSVSSAPISTGAGAHRKTERSDPVADSERRVERKDILFSPRKARPSGSVLECVAYWGDTVLDVELFHNKFSGYESVRIGDPTKAHFIAAGDDHIENHTLAEIREDGYRINLLKGMEARFRKGGKVESAKDKGRFKLGRRDIAHIKHGSVRYFLLFVRPPSLDLPRTGPRDPFFIGLSMFFAVLYFALILPIVLMDTPKELDELSDDDIAIVNIPIKEKPKPKIPKPKQQIAQKKTPPKTKPVPKPPPKPPKPVKPVAKKPPKQPKKQPQKSVVKKKALTSLTANKTQTNKNQKGRQDTKKPTNTQAVTNPLDALKKAGSGMPSTGAKNPDFKLSGPKRSGPKGPSGGSRGAGNNRAGGARKGKQKSNVYGVEGVNNNKASGVNLSKLGLGVGKVLSRNGAGAIKTNFKNSVGGAGGGSGSASRTYGLGGGNGNRQSLGLGGGSGANNFGAGGSGGYLGGEGGKGGLGGSGLGRGKGGGGRPRPDVGIPAGDAVVGGGLTQSEVAAVIRANLNQIRHCYEQLLQRRPSSQGKIKVEFVIATNGRVDSARVVSGSISDNTMRGCVTSRVKRWPFPKPRGGQPVTVKYPFVFTPL